MTSRIIALAAASFMLCSPLLAAQINWNDEACTYTVTFDAKKVDANALKNTANLLFEQAGSSLIGLPTFASLFSPEDAAQADTAKLQAECGEILQKGQDLRLLALPRMEDYRAALLEDTRDACALNGALIRGVKTPAALRDYTPALAACSKYIEALEGKANLEQVWRDTIEASCRQNASPAACRNREFDAARKPNGLEVKRLSVLNYGWNNCAVKFMRGRAPNSPSDALAKELQKQFKRQFKIVKSKCENPG